MEARYTAEQIGLFYYLGRKDEFTLAENEAHMTAYKLAEVLAAIFGAS